MALEASAELRETRGFISMTTTSPVSGLTANWTLLPPVSTPILRMIALEASRSSWYWASVSVSAGATVTLSPVCTPMGSMFSMEQMIDDVVGVVAHDLELELVPADDGLLEQHLRDRAERQPLLADAREALVVVGDAAAAAAERVGGADDEREAELRAGGLGLVHGLGQHAARRAQADLVHGRAELEAVLGAVDGLLVGADHLDLPEVEHAGALELHGQVERRLPAERGQQGVRALDLDDARERGEVERLDVRSASRRRGRS